MLTSVGTGQYSAIGTDKHLVAIGSGYKSNAGRRPVLCMHSAGGDALEPISAPNFLPILLAITERLDLPLISFDAQGVHWGNDNAQARTGDALAYLRGTWGAHATLPPVLVGTSMGAMLALNWARANPAAYAAAALLYPATSLQAIHDGTGGAPATPGPTEAAYGGSLATFNAAVATHDPAQNAAAYVGARMKIWRSSADTVVGTANQDAFAAASGIPVVDLGAVAHADMTKIPVQQIVDFLAPFA